MHTYQILRCHISKDLYLNTPGRENLDPKGGGGPKKQIKNFVKIQ